MERGIYWISPPSGGFGGSTEGRRLSRFPYGVRVLVIGIPWTGVTLCYLAWREFVLSMRYPGGQFGILIRTRSIYRLRFGILFEI